MIAPENLALKKDNKFSFISFLLFFTIISLIIYLAINNLILLFVIVGSLFSIWLAYFYPVVTIILLIVVGQIVQFELAKVIQSFSGLPIGNLNLRFSDPIIFGIIISIFVKAFIDNASIKRIIYGKGKYFTIFLLYVIIQVIKNWGTYGSYSFGEFRTYYQGFLILPYIALNTKLINERKKLFKVLIILSLGQILIALLKGAFIQNLSFEAYEKWLSAFGSLALLYGLFALYMYRKYDNIKISRAVIILTFTLGIIILLIASNRSVWLAGVTGFIFLIFQKEVNIKNQFVLLLVFLFVFVIAYLLFTTEGYDFRIFFSNRLNAFLDYQNDPTASWRFYIWSSIIQSIPEKLMFGFGLGGNFDIYIPELNNVLGNSPHNFYLAMLYELGLMGVLLFFIFIVKYIKDLVKLRTLLLSDNIMRKISFIVIACLVGYWIAYSTEKDFFTWCYLGLGFSIIINTKTDIVKNEK